MRRGDYKTFAVYRNETIILTTMIESKARAKSIDLWLNANSNTVIEIQKRTKVNGEWKHRVIDRWIG